MKTSYFGNIKNLPAGKAVAICQGVPHWYHGPGNIRLAPTWAMIRIAKEDPKLYKRYYNVLLLKLNPFNEFNRMEAMVNNGAILLCYEKPGEFCHRRLVAEWFEFHLGIEVPEFQSQEELL